MPRALLHLPALRLGVLACVGLGAAAGPAEGQLPPGSERPDADVARRIDAALEAVGYVAIPAGEFRMGCPADGTGCAANETPAHRVAITEGFEMGRHEVTQAVWRAVMGNNPSRFQAPDHPVEHVSWDDVQEFLAILNGRGDGWYYRLPTEAEWEYAARAGSDAASYGDLDSIAWYAGNSGGRTHPVGSRQPNAWGLHDMLGNVWEWCQDFYAADLYATLGEEPVRNPRGAASGDLRVLRGGSFYRFLWFVRAPARFGLRASARHPHIGFRCVRQER